MTRFKTMALMGLAAFGLLAAAPSFADSRGHDRDESGLNVRLVIGNDDRYRSNRGDRFDRFERRDDRLDARIDHARRNLNQALRSGQLNRREASRLSYELDRIIQDEHRAERSGRGIDREEARYLNERLERLNNQIYYAQNNSRYGDRDNRYGYNDDNNRHRF